MFQPSCVWMDGHISNIRYERTLKGSAVLTLPLPSFSLPLDIKMTYLGVGTALYYGEMDRDGL